MRSILALSVAVFLPASLAFASSDAQLCEAAKLKAATAFAACVGKADSSFSRSAQTLADIGKREDAKAKCEDKIVKAYAAAELRYGAECPKVGDIGTVKTYLTQCSVDLYESNKFGGGQIPDYSGQIATCAANLATALAGTATVADVLSGKTFSSSAGLDATGTMPDNGAVSVTPSTADQTIAAGYHNGSGVVAGDADLSAGNVRSGVNLFGVVGTYSGGLACGAAVLKTGQADCYNELGNTESCSGTGQDGELQPGAARSFTDNGDGTVTDDVTGLTWEKHSNDGSIHDQDNTYSWEQAFSVKLAALNAAAFAGHSDWRLPTIFELESLRHMGKLLPTTYSAFNQSCSAGCTVYTCSCTYVGEHWSSTALHEAPGNVWTVQFTTGSDVIRSKLNPGYVRAVRGAP